MISSQLEEISYVDPQNVSEEHRDYQSNRLAQDMGRYGHSTFKQFIRSMTHRIMGQEGLVEIQDLATNSHCPTLNTDFYRLAKSQPWARRKKFNPFKWLELAITTPLEVTRWGFQRGFFKFREWFLAHCGATRDMGQTFTTSTISTLAICFNKYPIKTIGACLIGSGLALGTVTLAVINELSYAVFRRCLAPARYIIRPSIELYKQHKKSFIAISMSSAAITIMVSALIEKGDFAIITATTAGAKIGYLFMIATSSWSICLRVTTGIHEGKQILKQIFMGLPRNRQVVSQFEYNEKGSTAKVSALLHGLNPRLTKIQPVEKQDCAYTFALFTGTEAVFFPETSIRQETATSKFILFSDLRKYPNKRRQDTQREHSLKTIEIKTTDHTTPLLLQNLSNYGTYRH